MTGAPHDERIVETANTHIVAGICIDARFFITRANDEPRVSSRTRQHDVSFNGVVMPIHGTSSQPGPSFIGIIAHGPIVQFPCSTECLPFIGAATRKRITVWQPPQWIAKGHTQNDCPQCDEKASQRNRYRSLMCKEASDQRTSLHLNCNAPDPQSIEIRLRTISELRFSLVTRVGSSLMTGETDC